MKIGQNVYSFKCLKIDLDNIYYGKIINITDDRYFSLYFFYSIISS